MQNGKDNFLARASDIFFWNTARSTSEPKMQRHFQKNEEGIGMTYGYGRIIRGIGQ